MFKKVLSVVVSLALILCLLPAGVISLPVSAETSGGYTYTVSSGKATITDYTGAGGGVVIPSTLGGYPVTSIGDGAFWCCSSLTSVTIPDGVTSIGVLAFNDCSSLAAITIPDGVTSIGNSAFSGCSSLTSITIPDSVTSIGDGAFCGCSSLTTITIPDGVTSIGDRAFYDCSSLTSITIPDSVTSIGYGAFAYCISLTTITIPDSVTSIGGYAFSLCSSLTSITIPDGVTSIGNYAFYDCSSLTGVTIPDGVTSIGDSAFWGCSRLTSITIPDSVTSIGNYAFYDCSRLTSITIPDGVTSIGYCAFYGCSSLTAITIPDGVTSIGDSAFYCCSSLTTITIPDGVTSIGRDAFSRCSRLTSITIPDSVTSIEDWAFQDCSSLTSITIPDGVTSIGDGAFSSCYSLTSITIPDSVTSIGEAAFYCCSSLTSVTIPDGVTSIGDDAFCGCSSLAAITIPDSVTSIGDGAFCGCSSLTSITIPDGVTSIGRDAFSRCSSLTSITIPDSVTSIGDYAFCYCSSLTSITIPDSVTSIGEYAFYGCSSLTEVWYGGSEANRKAMSIGSSNDKLLNATWHYADEADAGESDFEYTVKNGEATVTGYTGSGGDVVIPSTLGGCSVRSIGENAFHSCSQLVSVTIPEGVTDIAPSAFFGCANLTAVTLPNSVISIGNGAFRGCKSLASITIPNNVTTIEDCAFYDCSSLPSVTIPGSVTSMGGLVFYYCTGLTSVTILEGITCVEGYTFVGCRNLISVTIPNSVTEIGAQAFRGCTSLTSITIPNGVTKIGSYAFDNCASLVSINIPKGVTDIWGNTFSGCSHLTDVWYGGTQAEREDLYIGKSNDPLLSATWHYVTCQTGEHAYSGADDMSCDICGTVRTLVSIAVTTPPTEILYNELFKTFSVEGGAKLTLYYSDGAEELEDLMEEYLSGYDPSEQGVQPLTVTYNGVSTVLNFAVTFWHYIKRCEISLPQPQVGEAIVYPVEFDIQTTPIGVQHQYDWHGVWLASDDGIVYYLPDEGSIFEAGKYYALMCQGGGYRCWDQNTEFLIDGQPFDLWDFWHGEEKDGISILVGTDRGTWEEDKALCVFGPLEKSATAIAITTLPSKVSYLVGSGELSVDGGKVAVSYNDGTCEVIDLTAEMVSGFDNTVVGEQRVTVTYKNASTTFPVTVFGMDAPQFVVEDVTAKAGDTVTVAVKVKNNPGIVSTKLEIGYDANVLELISGEWQDFTGGVSGFSPTTVNPFVVNWANTLSGNNTTDGVLALLTFKVKDGAVAGDTVITVSYDPDDVYDENWDNVSFATVAGTVTVIEYISGDANDDGKVNNKDLGLLLQYLNKWDVTVVEAACDVNRDGKVNNKDLGLLLQYLNGWDVELK